MWNLILDFCPFFVGFSTVCVMFEKAFGKMFYVNFPVDLNPFRMGGKFWARKSRKWSSGLILQSKINFLEMFFFRKFRHNRHYFRQFDQNCFFVGNFFFIWHRSRHVVTKAHITFLTSTWEKWQIGRFWPIFDNFERSYLLGQKALAKNFWHVGSPQQLCFTQKIWVQCYG